MIEKEGKPLVDGTRRSELKNSFIRNQLREEFITAVATVVAKLKEEKREEASGFLPLKS